MSFGWSSRVAAVLLFFCALAFCGAAAAQVTVQSVVGLGSKGGVATGINNSGQVVEEWGSEGLLYSNGNVTNMGLFSPTGINNLGVVVGNGGHTYSNGQLTQILPGTGLHGINDSGDIVGVNVNGGNYAFLYSGGVMTDLGTLPGGGQSYASSINNSGEIAGAAISSSGQYHAFSWFSGVMTDLGTLGGVNSTAAQINSSGQIVGRSTVASNATHAFLFSAGIMTDLGILPGGANYSEANAINDLGEIVGDGFTQTADDAFVYYNGKMIDLNTLLPPNSGWSLTQAYGINNAGQIVGWGVDPAGNSEAFLLNTTLEPEPSSISLIAIGVALLALASKHRIGKGSPSGL